MDTDTATRRQTMTKQEIEIGKTYLTPNPNNDKMIEVEVISINRNKRDAIVRHTNALGMKVQFITKIGKMEDI